jgi:WD40 repeat protein
MTVWLSASTLPLALPATNAFAVSWKQPELVVQTGHARTIGSIAFSPDATLLASHAEDNTVRIWNALDGSQLRVLEGTHDATELAFTDDGKFVVALSAARQVTFWNTRSGLVERTYGNSVLRFAISSDRLLVVNDRCTVYDLTSDAKYPLESCAGDVYLPTFSHDGSWIAADSHDNGVQVWSAATGKIVQTLPATASMAVLRIAFSADSAGLALLGYGDEGITLYDRQTGLCIMRLEGSTIGLKRCIAFSPDGLRLVAGGSDGLLYIWDLTTGAAIDPLPGHTDWVTAVAYSADGLRLASGGSDRSVIVRSVSIITPPIRLASRVSPVQVLAFSPTAPLLATGHHDGTVTLWDARDGYNVRIIRPTNDLVRDAATLGPYGLFGYKDWDYREICALAFSSDGLHLAIGADDGTVRIWNIDNGAEEPPPPRLGGSVLSLSFSGDCRWLAIARRPSGFDNNGTARIWDLRRQRNVPLPWAHDRRLVALEFSVGRNVVAVDAAERVLRVWNLDTRKLLRKVINLPADISKVSVSRTGQLAAVANNTDTLIVNLADGSRRPVTCDGGTQAMTLAWGAARIAIASRTGSMCVSGLQPYISNCIHGDRTRTESVALNSSGSLLASSGGDGVVDIWEVKGDASVTHRLQLFALVEAGWMAVAPDGLFDGTPSGWDAALWRLQGNPDIYAPVEAFFNEFFYPGLLQDVLSERHPHAVANLADKDIRQPSLLLSTADPSDSTTVNVSVRIVEAPPDLLHPTGGSGATDVRLFRNGSVVRVWKGDTLIGRSSVTLDVTVPLLPGTNRFSAYAFNKDGVKSRDSPPLVVTAPPWVAKQRTLYIISIGVNKYSDPRLELRYAAADAKMFGDDLAIYQRQTQQFRKVRVLYLLDSQAAKERITTAIARLSGANAHNVGHDPEIPDDWGPAAVQDVVVIYFAGHGMAIGGRYFLLPSDVRTWNNRTLQQVGSESQSEALSDDEIATALEPVQAAKILLIIDACDSGQILGGETRRIGPMNTKGFAQMAFERGMSVVAAAKDGQLAREPSSLGHGILTYSLIEEGLRRAKVPTNVRGEITEQAWLQYAVTAVPRIYALCCGPRAVRRVPRVVRAMPRGARSFLVDGNPVIPEGKVLQEARVFYGRSGEESWTIRHVPPPVGDQINGARKVGDMFMGFLRRHKFDEARRLLSSRGRQEIRPDSFKFLWLELERSGGGISSALFRLARNSTAEAEVATTVELLYDIGSSKGYVGALLRARLYDGKWFIDSFTIRDDLR